MKKPITEDRSFCDFCAKDEPAYAECLVCGKDICVLHRIVFTVFLDREDRAFRASLCPEHGKILLPILQALQAREGTSRSTGHSPEFNAAQLLKILDWIEHPPVATARSQ